VLGKRRVSTASATGLIAVAAMLMFSSIAGAAPPGGAGRPATERCQPADPGHAARGHSEFSECFTVTAALSRPPAVGEISTLTVEVTSPVHRDSADVAVHLPANLEWVTAPDGLSVSRDARAKAYGPVIHAVQRRSLAAGQHLRYAGTVRAVAAGPAEIQARVTAQSPTGPDSGGATVFLTVGGTAGTGRFGIEVPTNPTGVDVPADVQPATRQRPAAPPPDPAERFVAGPPTTGDGATIAATACVRGLMVYQDNFGITLPSANMTVRVFDRGTFSDSLIGTGLTAFDGSYTVCFDNDDDGAFSGGRDPYVTISTENARWKVHGTDGKAYSVQVDGPNNVADGSTTNLGSTQPPSSLHRGWHAFDWAHSAWTTVPHGSAGCWDANDSVCHPQILVKWTPTSVDGDFFCPQAGSGSLEECPVANTVHLVAGSPDSHDTLHELGHAYMWDVYEHQGPFTANCANHMWGVALSVACAWSEGFASWYALAVSGSRGYAQASGIFLELEDTSRLDWDLGDATEGRITSALLDLSDGANNGQLVQEAWDEFSGSRANVFSTLVNAGSAASFNQFWNQHKAGMAQSTVDKALGAIYQNTVDYGFRPVLGSRGGVQRPIPLIPTHYSVTTTHAFWSVLAITPETRDYDLEVRDGTGLLASSTSGFDADLPAPDFVAIDSNHRPTGGYQATVYRFEPKFGVISPYTVRFVDGDTTVAAGRSTVFLGANQTVEVRDVFLTAGQKIQVKAEPKVPGQYPQLFLMASDPNSASTWVRGRGSEVAAGLPTGPGYTATTPQYLAPRTAWYGIVLINKQPAAGGNYDLTVTIT